MLLIQIMSVLAVLLLASHVVLSHMDRKKKLVSEIHSEKDLTQLMYDSINHAIKTHQPVLELSVQDMPIEEFMPFYKGLKEYYPALKFELHAHFPSRSEYLLFDLASYQGPRNIPLAVRKFYEPVQKTTESNPNVVLLPIKKSPKKDLTKSAQVIDFQEFKNRKKIIS